MMVLVTTKKDCRGFILFKRREMMAKRGGLKTREKKKEAETKFMRKQVERRKEEKESGN